MGLLDIERSRPADPRYSELKAEAYRTTNRRFLLWRTGGVVVLGLFVVVLPFEISPVARYGLSAFLGLIIAPSDLILDYRAGGRRQQSIQVVRDSLAACIVMFMAPDVWLAGIIVAVGVLVASIPSQSRAMVAALSVVVALCMGGSGMMLDIDHWYLPTITLLAIMPGFDAYYRLARKQAEAARERYDTLIDAASVFFWELDLKTQAFTSVAGNLRRLLGYSPDEFLAMQWWDIVPKDDQKRLMELPELAEGEERAMVTKITHRNGHDVVFRHVVNRDGSADTLRGVSSNINDLVEAAETIRFQAEHDDLTGLLNRAVLVKRLRNVVEHGEAANPVAVLMLDLNRFKEVNDTLGHPVGDQLLQILAERLTKALPDAEVVARLGGDEFAVLLTKNVTRARALSAARRISQALEQKLEIDRLKLAVSASIGVVLSPDHGETADELLQHADIAMYAAKRKGEPVEVFESTPQNFSLERLTLSASIGSAVVDNQFELWFQPKLCLQTMRIVGAEALARWRHPERGVLEPSEFLELISLSGEYHRFTDRVLERGVQAAALCAERGHAIEIAVNLSSLSFFDQRLPNRLQAQLAGHRVEPERFTLEITEADILDETGSHHGVFQNLKDLGVGVAIDDFGTGHSSLARLRELPVTELKLDRSFVSKLETDTESKIIVRTVVDLALALGLRTVAEGVETEETASILRSIGCQAAQGFLYSKPMPEAEFLSTLDRWSEGTGAWSTAIEAAKQT